jgi:hypothetical protein
VKRAIKTAQAKLREKALYDAEEAVKEIETMIKGALGATSPNYMAGAKLVELKCKLYGLICEKLEVAVVDLRGALKETERRVFDVTPRQPCAKLGTVADPAVSDAGYNNGPGEKGNPFAG